MSSTYIPLPPEPLAAIPMQPVKVQPSQLGQTPEPMPAQAGWAGKGGQAANLIGNALAGWMRGKHLAEQKKLERAQSDVDMSLKAFNLAAVQASNMQADPNVPDATKKQAVANVSKQWNEYLQTLGQYAGPQKGKGGKKGSGGIGGFFKRAFGAENPEFITPERLQQLSQLDPKALIPQPSPQDQLARTELNDIQKEDALKQQLADAIKKNAPDDEINRLSDELSAFQGKVKTPQERLANTLASSANDYAQGKPISPQAKAELEAQGFLPKPVLPQTFLQGDQKGNMFAVSIDPNDPKKVTKTPIGIRERIPPTAREAAGAEIEAQLTEYGKLYKQAHPDATAQQIAQAKSDMLASGVFHVKIVPNMTPVQAESALSRALHNVYAQLPKDVQDKFNAIVVPTSRGTWMFRSDMPTEDPSHWYNPATWGDSRYSGMSKDEVIDAQDQVRSAVRTELEKEGYSDDQVDAMLGKEPSISDKMKMAPTPSGENAGYQVGDIIEQGNQKFKVTKTDKDGKVLAADPQ